MGIQNYNVSIFRVVSFNAFWNFLWLRNSAWDFYGDKFWSRNFLGFRWKPTPIDHPVLEIRSTPWDF